jgi:hypothetical protein
MVLVCLGGCGDTSVPETDGEEDSCGPAVTLTDDWSVAVVGTQSPAEVVASLAGEADPDPGSLSLIEITSRSAPRLALSLMAEVRGL